MIKQQYTNLDRDRINKQIATSLGWVRIIDDEWGPIRGLKDENDFKPNCKFIDIPDYLQILQSATYAVGSSPTV